MNVSSTAKRFFRSAAVLALVAVCGSAFAVDYYGVDDFEGYSEGTAAVDLTGWEGSSNDLSQVVHYTNVSFAVESGGITPPTTGDQVLELNTEGNTLTNDTSVPGATQVYIDQYVYLVPSDDTPYSITNDTSIQAAVYLNSSSNLVVYHGNLGDLTSTFTAIPTEVLPNTWIRLTISMDYTSADVGLNDEQFFKVTVDETDLTSASAYDSPSSGASTPGSWFVCANRLQAAANQLTSVSYQGTGAIDDLLITDQDPFGVPPAFFTIASYPMTPVNGTISDVDITVATGGDTQVVYTANTYYQIGALYENGSEVITAAGMSTYTLVYTGVSQNYSNYVVFADITGYGGVPASWYGPLGSDGSQNEDGDSLDLDEEYALNTSPTVSNEFEITAVGIDGSDKPYVKWLSLGAANGTIVVSNTIDLAGGIWSNVPGSTVHSAGENTWTSDLDADPTAIYKVVVSN